MRKEIALIAGHMDWSETQDTWLNKVPNRVKTVSHRTVKALWYGEISDPDHWAARDIRRAAEVIKAQREAAALASQLETIVNGLNASDPDFHKPSVAALVSALRSLRGQDRS
jgi:NADPH-dependent glutamate synthase beta subunit-like oxidoreductase